MLQLEQELKSNAYPGRGIVIGRSANGKYAVTAYFIMGRSANSRNRVFVTEGGGRAVRRSRLFYERADAKRASPRPAEGTFQHHVRNPQHR